jgi:hypothetical protein
VTRIIFDVSDFLFRFFDSFDLRNPFLNFYRRQLTLVFCVLLLITVVSQFYSTEAENEYVIRGNAGVIKCKIPSFVSDFVYVESWISDSNEVFTRDNNDEINHGKFTESFRHESVPYIL